VSLLTDNGLPKSVGNDVVALISDINDRVIRVNTIANATAKSSLVVGSTVLVKEYATGYGIINAVYDIVASGTGTEDKIIYHNSDTVGAFQLKLRLGKGQVNIQLAGAANDGSDVSTEWQRAVSFIEDNSVNDYYLYLPNGTYEIRHRHVSRVSIIGESMRGVRVEHNDQEAGAALSIRALGYMDAAETKNNIQPIGETAVSTRAKLDAQGAGLNYVTCKTPSEADNFSVGDTVMVAAGKNPFDADDTNLWRYVRPLKIKRIDASTGKVELSQVIPTPLSNDGFAVGEPYYNPSDWVASTSYTKGDVVYGNSLVGIDADLAADADRWLLICENLGASINSPGNDRTPVMQKMESPCIAPQFSNFTIAFTASKTPLACFYITATYDAYIHNVEIEGSYNNAILWGGQNSQASWRRVNHNGSATSEAAYAYCRAWTSDVEGFESEAVSGAGVSGKEFQPMIFLEGFANLSLNAVKLSRTLFQSLARIIVVQAGCKLSIKNSELWGAGNPITTTGSGVIAKNITSGTDSDPYHWKSIITSAGGNSIQGNYYSALMPTNTLSNFAGNTFYLTNLAYNYDIRLGRDHYVFVVDDVEVVQQSFTPSESKTDTNVTAGDSVPVAFQAKGNYWVVRIEVYYENAPAGASIDVSPYIEWVGGNYSPMWNNSFASDRSTVTVSANSPHAAFNNGAISGQRLLLTARSDRFGFRYTSNSSATGGTLHVRFYTMRDSE
jgi:hypothetical protein